MVFGKFQLNRHNNFFYYLGIEVFFVVAICVIIYYFTNFQYGKYIFAGDFRLDIHSEHVGEHFLSLMSEKFSTNNFVYSSFYPLYFLLQFVPYHVAMAYIFFGIPVLLYVSLKYVLLRITGFFISINRIEIYFLYSVLAFYYAINPAFFERYVHWPFLQSEIILPIFAYAAHKMFTDDRVFNKYLFALPFLLYFGAIAPQFVIVYTITAGLIFVDYLINYSQKKWINIFCKMGLFFIGGVLSFFHTFYLILSGYGVTKSFHESETNSNVLSILSRESSIFTAISGTNFFESFIHPYVFSVGFILFLFAVILFIRQSRINKRSAYLLLVTLGGIVVISGYKVFPEVFNVILSSYAKNFLWVVKDPNMYYPLFVLSLTFLVVYLLRRDTLFKHKKFILMFACAVFALNCLSILSFDKEKFNHYFSFIDIPYEYFELSDNLEFSDGRNVWLPYSWYVQKSFTRGQTHFPNPAFWLTKNKELIDFNVEYKFFMETIDNEIYAKNCRNIYFLDWLLATQNLNIIIDHYSVTNEIFKTENTENKVILTEQCMRKLPHVYEYKKIGKISVYKSSLDISQEFVYYKDSTNIDKLNDFVKDNPVNITDNRDVDLDQEYSVLNEAYDDNWRMHGDKLPLARANLFSMLFAGKDDMFYYRGDGGFQKIVLFQKIIIATLLLIGCLFWIKNLSKRIV